EHNLKNIDLTLPRNKLIVFTGLSGSGKSTLAFDTIFAEGQRRYLESLSSYARQFLGQMEKPDVESIEGLSPSISIDQKAASHNPRSTVGTVTEIYDYLRLLFARIGIPHCPIGGEPIKKFSQEQMIEKILDLGEGKRIQIYAPVIRGRKGEYQKLLENFHQKGYLKANINGKLRKLERNIKLSRYKQHSIEILIDEFEISADNLNRLSEAIEESLKIADGLVTIFSEEKKQIFNQKLTCPEHSISLPEIEPRIFSFNSPFGACKECDGLGSKKEIDPYLIIPDKNLSISQGAIMPLSYKPNNYYGVLLRAIAEKFQFSEHTPIKNLPENILQIILYGSDDGVPETLRVRYYIHGRGQTFYLNFQGIIPVLEKRYRTTESDAIRKQIEHYLSQRPCPNCGGTRLEKESLLVKIAGKSIAEISSLTIDRALIFFQNLKLSDRDTLVAEKILTEIKNRLVFLVNVGLNYLTLERAAFTLAGGEAQRIRLASQIGSGLVGVLYILDEPSVGLHARDNQNFLDTLKKLRDLGNTLIVIEHDEATMRAADLIVDIGPGAGSQGGQIVACGDIKEIENNPQSLTGQYLSDKKQIDIPKQRRNISDKFIKVIGACEHNLQNLTVYFPLGVFVGVTGVSGSGKSTLVNEILYKALARRLHSSIFTPGKFAFLEGAEQINKAIIIDQSPIGRTPRSNPATYTNVFTSIRELFAQTKEARLKGYLPGRFSFNVAGGRCDHCQGDGVLKIEMHFLPDIFIPCDVCGGKRFNRETLEIKFKGKNIWEVLEMTVTEAREFFKNIYKIDDILQTLIDVGLGYIKLGQPATTLSGGEAQRIKLAEELARLQKGKTLYILDEPTTGLHFDDIKRLLSVLQKLVDEGNTVVVIEHNLDVIKSCDYLIDLGPEGGEKGGKVVATGTPEEITKNEKSFTGQYLSKVLNQ
ncbi:MAG: excinuclease ABC subunit UvrA, partial [Patescibacteria group bacterium]